MLSQTERPILVQEKNIFYSKEFQYRNQQFKIRIGCKQKRDLIQLENEEKNIFYVGVLENGIDLKKEIEFLETNLDKNISEALKMDEKNKCIYFLQIKRGVWIELSQQRITPKEKCIIQYEELKGQLTMLKQEQQQTMKQKKEQIIKNKSRIKQKQFQIQILKNEITDKKHMIKQQLKNFQEKQKKKSQSKHGSGSNILELEKLRTRLHKCRFKYDQEVYLTKNAKKIQAKNKMKRQKYLRYENEIEKLSSAMNREQNKIDTNKKNSRKFLENSHQTIKLFKKSLKEKNDQIISLQNLIDQKKLQLEKAEQIEKKRNTKESNTGSGSDNDNDNPEIKTNGLNSQIKILDNKD
ncbi:hypothetical protein M0813_07341 [Anaeramoeba flamelloides]|uniref:Uncharacterized protein n=1 Tax=Anaeramoeba flamelloides TaxID=1746091 RepID=A0ABQ8XAM5_9EUKA|nr:hypothetical protein M0813_07341 [Anaeramoeba flamelloides]